MSEPVDMRQPMCPPSKAAHDVLMSLREKCPVCGDQGCTNCGRVPQPFELWKHFKGGVYEIVDVDTLFVTDGLDFFLVRYRNEKGVFARTLQDFIQEIDSPEYEGPRFVKLTLPVTGETVKTG